MSVVDDPRAEVDNPEAEKSAAERADAERPLRATEPADTGPETGDVVDTGDVATDTGADAEDEAATDVPSDEDEAATAIPSEIVLPRGPRGLRIRRVRLKSVAALASVFFVLGYLVTIGSLVVLWNVAQRLGFVADFEDLIETSLGLDSFDVTGAGLFELAVVGFGIIFAIGLVITILLAIVYNAACALLGGLAVETGPLRRPRKVFSPRHRRFINVR